MSWRERFINKKSRQELIKLGRELSDLKRDHAAVSNGSSRMVKNRIHGVESDYWRAVKAFSTAEYEFLSGLLRAAFLEIEFIRKLMEAETTERELGESTFFEYRDKEDLESGVNRMEKGLDAIALELLSLLEECKKKP